MRRTIILFISLCLLLGGSHLARASWLDSEPNTWKSPLAASATISQGPRDTLNCSEYHSHCSHPLNMCAVDLVTESGTAVLAPADGKVMRQDFDTYGGGNFLVVKHGDRASLYLHLSRYVASVGNSVSQGQVLACSGSGGTGSHLHFSAMKDTSLGECISMVGIDGNTNLARSQIFHSSNQVKGNNPCSVPIPTIPPAPTIPPPAGSPPSAPGLASPGNSQTLSPTAEVTFQWNAVSEATQYYVEYWGDPYGTLNSGWQFGTSFQVGTMWPGSYSWRVKARNNIGESGWSETRSFIIAENTETPAPSNTPQPQAPATPSLREPTGGASFPQTTDVWFSWHEANNAAQYYLEYWGGSYGTLNSGWIGDTAHHIGTMWPGTYSWHVKARDNNGVESNWSETWTFTIQESASSTSPPAATNTPVPPPTNTPLSPTATPVMGNVAPQSGRTPNGINSGNAFDGNLSTFWTDGLGHKFTLTLSLPGTVTINRIIVWDRPQNSPDNNQINALVISLGNGISKRFDMVSQGPRCIDVTLSSPQTVSSVTLRVDDGSGNNGLSEVEIWAGPKTSGPTCSNTGTMP